MLMKGRCRECGESLGAGPFPRWDNDGFRPGLCVICNDIATEQECLDEQRWFA
jgi:hypothetical protein